MPRRALRLRRALVLLSLAATMDACQPAAPPVTSADPEFTALRDRYFVRHLELNPVTSTYLGGDGYRAELGPVNGRLRDYAPQALAAELGFYREVRQALEAIDPARLPAVARIDHQLLDTLRQLRPAVAWSAC